jgi:hypothetical protein
LSTSQISNIVQDAGGNVIAGVPVIIDLIPGPAFRMTDGNELDSTVETKTDVTGKWLLALEQSGNIDPLSAYYRVREMIPKIKGGARTWFFRVPNNNALLHDCLITPSVANALIRPSVVTSSTRPSSPYIGQMIFESDTGKVLYYYGSTLGWLPNWYVPWGEVANTTMLASFSTSSTTMVEVTGISNTALFTAINGRRYLTTFNGWVQLSGAAATINLSLRKADGVTSYRDTTLLFGTQVSWTETHYSESRDAEAGVVGRRLFLSVTSGGTAAISANSVHPAMISVYDVGPSANPVIT